MIKEQQRKNKNNFFNVKQIVQNKRNKIGNKKK